VANKWWADRKERGRQKEQRRQDEQEREQRRIDAAVDHSSLLIKAAAIATVDLRCHEHTWDFICQEAAALDLEHFRPPGDDMVIRMDGTVTVPVSGPTLVVILEALHQASKEWEDEQRVRRSVASAAYINLSARLSTTDFSLSGTQPVRTLAIDNRPRAEDDTDEDAPAYGYGEYDRPLATRRDQVAEDIRKVLRSGGCREFTDDHGGFAVEGASDERGAPFLVAAADDDGDQKADVIRYTELLRAAGYRVEPEDGDPLSVQVWIPHP